MDKSNTSAHYKYDAQPSFEPIPARNSAVAIYRHREGATKACKASPLRFRYGESSKSAQEYGLHAMDSETPSQAPGATKDYEKSDSDQTMQHGQTANASSAINPNLSQSAQKTPKTPQQTNNERELGREVHLQISASTLNHELYLKRQYYHGRWKPSVRTVMARDLEKRTPIPHLGNLELYKGEMLPGIRKRRDENPKPPLPTLGSLRQVHEAK